MDRRVKPGDDTTVVAHDTGWPQNALRRDLGVREGRYLRGEAVEPGDELRMLGAPVPGEAQVAVTEEAGHGDLPDVRNGIERRRVGFERLDGARDLGVLIVEPFRDV